jgi:hypothetical protein
MNKDQRKYLTDWVTSGFKKEEESISARRYTRPNLNNYLVAAALDGSLQVRDAATIKDHVRQIVLSLGQGDALIRYESSSYGRRKYLDDTHVVTIKADELFIFPQVYLDELEKWHANERLVQDDLQKLRGTKDTVLLKVNIGSDKALEDVIAQADSLATLDLVNRQLTAATTKALEK